MELGVFCCCFFSHHHLHQVAVFERTFLFERLPNENPNGKRTSSSSSTNHRPLHRDAHIAWAEQQSLLERTKRPIITTTNPGGGAERYPPRNEAPNDRWWFSDELWPAQWYLQDGQDQLNLNVLAVYERGWTGRGVRVAVLDDGLEHWHEDLAQNYVRRNFQSVCFLRLESSQVPIL